MRRASSLQPSAGAWRSVVSRPVDPPCAAIAARASTTAPRSGCVPPIMTHQAESRSRVAARRAQLAQVVRAGERGARAERSGALRGGVGGDGHERRLQRSELVERHGQPLAQLSPGAPAHRGGRPVGARAEPVARELRRHLGVLGREPRAADLDQRARAGERARPGAPAGAIPRLQHQHGATGVREIARRAQPGEAGADDDCIEHVRHAPSGARSSQSVMPQVITSQTQSAPFAAPW